MDILWHIVLTVCLGNGCLSQDLDVYDNIQACNVGLQFYYDFPADNKWDSVTYECLPLNGQLL